MRLILNQAGPKHTALKSLVRLLLLPRMLGPVPMRAGQRATGRRPTAMQVSFTQRSTVVSQSVVASSPGPPDKENLHGTASAWLCTMRTCRVHIPSSRVPPLRVDPHSPTRQTQPQQE